MKKILLNIILLLTISPSEILAQRTFPEKDFSGYLFAYFTGNKVEEEALRFAVSPDGFKFYALNSNNAVLDSKAISETGGIRDPHILRGEDGTFYMVMTDMTSSKGWSSNRGMILLKSKDLVNWRSSKINIQKRFPNNENLQRVWAPQTIFDAKAGKYLIYFSMKHGEDFDKIYYAYANKDFTDLESEPKILFIPKSNRASIDGDILMKDGVYHLFYKTEEGKKGIKTATTNDLTSGNWTEQNDYKQQTDEAVEGSGVFKLNHSNDYVLMYDVYMKGQYQFTKSSDLEHFSVIDHEISMDFHPRHGTIIPLKRSELKALFSKWGKPAKYPEPEKNPVLEGFYADPEILYSNKTRKFYLYPTSDGFQGWSGDFFEVFSSDNLVDWKNEGKILDLKADVPWGNRNAWAPTAIEKKVNGKYQYFYYFTAAQKIGVAVSDNPFGPFNDSGKALIDQKPIGVSGGQNIDPDVFTDPKTGKSYLYWGNGFMAVAELNPDMISVKPNSVKVIEVDKTFREGTEVFYREGTYYFMWSEDDTRSPNYRVRYGTSKSPIGPITISPDNIVIEKNESQSILATGHNSVLNIPGTDDWYIVYHRFNIPDGAKMGDAAGFHREVCIDRMTFSKDGKIEKVTPTLNGIAPVMIPKNKKK